MYRELKSLAEYRPLLFPRRKRREKDAEPEKAPAVPPRLGRFKRQLLDPDARIDHSLFAARAWLRWTASMSPA